jgi:hypothetical protein
MTRRVPFRLLADMARVGAAVGVLATLVGIPSFGMGARFLLVFLVLMVPRAIGGVPAPVDLAFSAALLAAMWISTAGWSEASPISWLVPAVATGITAAVLYLVLAGVGALPDLGGRPSRVGVVGRTVVIGLVVGGVWEAYRWFESLAAPTPVLNTGSGLAVRLLVDAAGGLVAGLGLAVVGPHGRDRPAGTEELRSVVVADRRRAIL